MDIFENVTKMTSELAHGEVNFFRIEEGQLPSEGWTEFTDKTASGDFIVGHSEQGHHHLLEAEGVTVMERTDSAGFRILKALVEKPVKVKQDAANPHAPHVIQPGTYVIRDAREKLFFQEQARRVAD